jgi:hypothetical protein
VSGGIVIGTAVGAVDGRTGPTPSPAGHSRLIPRHAQSQPYRLFVADKVDSDVSYVHNAYVPGPREPYGNAYR